MKTTILKATHLTKKFSSPALVEVLKDVDVEVCCGESVAIVGKSGEGKSTLLHILGTLEKPCSGMLEICGQNTTHTFLPKLRNQHIGFIFQSYNLLDEYTTLENVLMPAKIARKAIHRRSLAYKRALELLEIVGFPIEPISLQNFSPAAKGNAQQLQERFATILL